jgi:hypothetical protein
MHCGGLVLKPTPLYTLTRDQASSKRLSAPAIARIAQQVRQGK